MKITEATKSELNSKLTIGILLGSIVFIIGAALFTGSVDDPEPETPFIDPYVFSNLPTENLKLSDIDTNKLTTMKGHSY